MVDSLSKDSVHSDSLLRRLAPSPTWYRWTRLLLDGRRTGPQMESYAADFQDCFTHRKHDTVCEFDSATAKYCLASAIGLPRRFRGPFRSRNRAGHDGSWRFTPRLLIAGQLELLASCLELPAARQLHASEQLGLSSDREGLALSLPEDSAEQPLEGLASSIASSGSSRRLTSDATPAGSISKYVTIAKPVKLPTAPSGH